MPAASGGGVRPARFRSDGRVGTPPFEFDRKTRSAAMVVGP